MLLFLVLKQWLPVNSRQNKRAHKGLKHTQWKRLHLETGFPLALEELENLEKWEGVFQSGKITQNTGKFREFQTNICYFFVIFKWTVYILLKGSNFQLKKTKHLKNTGKVREFFQSGKVGTMGKYNGKFPECFAQTWCLRLCHCQSFNTVSMVTQHTKSRERVWTQHTKSRERVWTQTQTLSARVPLY